MARICRIWSLPALLGALTVGMHGGKAATPSQAAAAAAAAQSGPSIVASFNDFWTAARGKPFAQEGALWNRYVEGPREPLYRSVVWEVRENLLVPGRGAAKNARRAGRDGARARVIHSYFTRL